MNRLLLLIMLVLGMATSANAQAYASPTDYLKRIGGKIDQVKMRSWDYTRQVTHGRSAGKAEKTRRELVDFIKLTKTQVLQIPTYKGDTEVRDSVVAWLRSCYYVVKDDFGALVRMENDGGEGPNDTRAWIDRVQEVNHRLEAASKGLDVAMQSYGDRFGVEITKNPDSYANKLHQANRVTDYYNTHNFLLWECTLLDDEMVVAMREEDVGRMEKITRNMGERVNEGRAKVNETGDYEGDETLKRASLALLDFYEGEAKTDFPKIIEFFQLEQKISGSENPAREDVEKFNAMIEPFNELNEEMHNEHIRLINVWNSTGDQFQQKHTPR